MLQDKRKQQVKQWVAILIALTLVVYSGFTVWRSSQILKDVSDGYQQMTGKSTATGPEGLEMKVLAGGSSQEKIVVLPMHGMITDGPVNASDPQAYNHQTLLDTIKLMKEDSSVVGVLFDVDSGGGAVYEGVEMYRRLKEFKEETDLPVYTVMRNMGASAAYYIPMASDRIYAAPETMTGSIGVIMNAFNYAELADKLGVKSEVIKTGQYKDIGNPMREMTDDERQLLQKEADASLDDFVQAVMEGRQLSEEAVRKVATGQVFNGREALELGLIDELGYYDEALEALIEASDSTDPMVVTYHHNKAFSPWDWMDSIPFIKHKLIPSQSQTQSPEAWIQAVEEKLQEDQIKALQPYSLIGAMSDD